MIISTEKTIYSDPTKERQRLELVKIMPSSRARRAATSRKNNRDLAKAGLVLSQHQIVVKKQKYEPPTLMRIVVKKPEHR